MSTEPNVQPGRLKRIQEFLGLKQSIVALLFMVVLLGMGEKMAERFLPIYLVALGGMEILAGFLNGFDNLLGALYSFPGGYLSDRLGYKKALMVFNLIAMAGFLTVILIPAWPAVFIGSFLFLSWTAISLPATMDLVSKVLPKKKRTMGVSVHSLVRRIPMAIGPVIGGYFIAKWGRIEGVRLAFVVAFIFGAVSLAMQQYLIEEQPPEEKKKKAEANPFRMLAMMCPELKSLLVSDILIRFCEQMPYAYIALYAMDRIHLSAPTVGWLTALEMLVAMLVYIPVAWLADKGNKKPYVVTTFVFFTLFPLVFWLSHSLILMVFAFILRGLKEFGEPTRKALIMDLAPEDRKAGMFGAYYLVRDLIVSVSAFGGAYLWTVSPAANFLTAFGFGVLGTIWFAVWGRDHARR